MISERYFDGATHKAELGGHVRYFSGAGSFDDACHAVLDAAGVPVNGTTAPLVTEVSAAPASIPPVLDPQPTPRRIGTMDEAGRDRVLRDEKIATAAGFVLPEPIYETGLAATGIERHRAEYDALRPAKVEAAELQAKVCREGRKDIGVQRGKIRMTKDGILAVPQGAMALTDRALPRLASRLDMPKGAGGYLSGVWPELRAINVNRWTSAIEAEEAAAPAKKDGTFPEPSTVVLRTRKGASGVRHVWGAVSPGYTPFDVDKVAEAIELAVPADAKGSVSYDGYRMRFDSVWMTDVQAGNEVAGEILKAGVRVRTDDTGGGSVTVEALVWRNLCLNCIIIGTGRQAVARIVHMGSVAELAKRFRRGFAEAARKLEGFRELWGYAVQEDVITRSARAATHSESEYEALVGRPFSEFLPGLFNGCIERELVPLRKSKREETVQDLVRMYHREEYVGPPSRWDVVNAFTRYAHEVESDPFKGHEIEAAAGALLVGKRGKPPAPLPYVSMES